MVQFQIVDQRGINRNAGANNCQNFTDQFQRDKDGNDWYGFANYFKQGSTSLWYNIGRPHSEQVIGLPSIQSTNGIVVLWWQFRFVQR